MLMDQVGLRGIGSRVLLLSTTLLRGFYSDPSFNLCSKLKQKILVSLAESKNKKRI